LTSALYGGDWLASPQSKEIEKLKILVTSEDEIQAVVKSENGRETTSECQFL
jgi:hypothetical protein